MRAKWWAAAAVVLVAASSTLWIVLGTTGGAKASAAGSRPVTTAVVDEPLSSQLDLDATLGYAGSYDVVYPASSSAAASPSGGSTPTGSASSPSSDDTPDKDDAAGNPGQGSAGCPTSTSTTTTTTTVPPTTTTTPASTGTTTTTSTTAPGATTTAPTQSTTTTTTTVPPTTTTTTTSRPHGPTSKCNPGSGQPSSSNQPSSPNPSSSNQPSSSQPSSSNQPSSGQPSNSGEPIETYTALPSVGQVIIEGQSLFSVNGVPAVLLYGSTPAWRALSPGLAGPDVAELNADLVALGYATSTEIPAGTDEFTSATKSAVDALEAGLGVSQTGSLALGQVVFLPTAARITSVSATKGGAATAGQQVLGATSTSRSVTVTLDASQQSQLEVGDPVSITLPDGRSTPGVVSAVGTTATAGQSDGPPGSGSGPPTIQVGITPSDPAATGTVDQAPVTVTITTATVGSTLATPVAALVSTSKGAPALEVAGPGRATHRQPVSVGIVDDSSGMVQVSGAGLTAGERVVLPAVQRSN